MIQIVFITLDDDDDNGGEDEKPGENENRVNDEMLWRDDGIACEHEIGTPINPKVERRLYGNMQASKDQPNESNKKSHNFYCSF